MLGNFVVTLSILFQTAATVLAFRLVPVARKHPAVILISATGLLMLFRRIMVLSFILSGNSLTPFEEIHELLGLAVSLCLFGAMLWAVPQLLFLVRTRDNLREKHSSASQMIMDLAIPALVIDHNHTVIQWNRACENLTGIPHEEMVGTQEPWRAFYNEARPILADLVVDNVSEEDFRALYGDSCSLSETIEGGWEAEFHLPAIRNGRWFSFSAGPLRDSEGNICGAIETFRDNTRQREADESLSRSELKLRTLHRIVHEIAGEKSVEDLLQRTVDLLDERMSISNVSILKNIAKDPSKDVMFCLAAASALDTATMKRLTKFLQDSGRGLSVKAAKEKTIIITPDVRKAPEYVPFTEGTISEIDVPVIDGERVLGVISVEGSAPFDSQDEELFTILAGHVASLWKSLDLVSEVKSLALTDSLTTLPNRRALYERLNEEENRMIRHRGVLSVIMMDMNRFKEINDKYGHHTGDAVLKAVALILSGSLRNYDFAARFGGDEFIVMLPDTGPQGAATIIERITGGLSGILVEGMALDLGAEFGLASFPEDGEKLTEVLKAADDRMYESKRSRDRPIVDP